MYRSVDLTSKKSVFGGRSHICSSYILINGKRQRWYLIVVSAASSSHTAVCETVLMTKSNVNCAIKNSKQTRSTGINKSACRETRQIGPRGAASTQKHTTGNYS